MVCRIFVQVWFLSVFLILSSFSNSSVVFAAGKDLLSLEELIGKALNNNTNVKSQSTSTEAFLQDIEAERKGWYPALNVQSSLDSSSTGGSEISIDQPLWSPSIQAAISLSEAELSEQMAKEDEVKFALVQDIVDVYFEVLKLQERHQIALDSESWHSTFLAQINRLKKAEISVRSDVLLVDSRYRQAQREAILARQELRSKLAELERLVNLKVPAVSAGFTCTNVSTSLGVFEGVAIANNPGVKRAGATVFKLREFAEQERSNLYPRLSVGVRTRDDGDGFRDATAFLSFSYSTGSGLASLDKAEAANVRLSAAEFELDSERSAIKLKVAQLMDSYLSYGSQMDTLVGLKKAAEDYVQSTKSQFDVGKRSWMDLLNSNREKKETLYTYVDSFYGFKKVGRQINIMMTWPNYKECY